MNDEPMCVACETRRVVIAELQLCDGCALTGGHLTLSEKGREWWPTRATDVEYSFAECWANGYFQVVSR